MSKKPQPVPTSTPITQAAQDFHESLNSQIQTPVSEYLRELKGWHPVIVKGGNPIQVVTAKNGNQRVTIEVVPLADKGKDRPETFTVDLNLTSSGAKKRSADIWQRLTQLAYMPWEVHAIGSQVSVVLGDPTAAVQAIYKIEKTGQLYAHFKMEDWKTPEGITRRTCRIDGEYMPLEWRPITAGAIA